MKTHAGIALLSLVVANSFVNGDVLWDNGPMVTHPGGHPSGADLSVSQPGSAMGGNVGMFGTGTYFRRADEFTVKDDGGWIVDTVRIYLYSTGLPTDLTGLDVWHGINMNIWDGMPGSGDESLVATSILANLDTPEFTNIYRVSSGDPAATDRPIFQIDVQFNDVLLEAGEYWIDYQVNSNSIDGYSAWTLVVMDLDENGQSVSRPGNSRQMPIPTFGTEWETWVHAPFNHTFELAFQVHGTVESKPALPGDLNGDGVIDVADLLILLSAWGDCSPGEPCDADLNGDGIVNVVDMLILLGNWG